MAVGARSAVLVDHLASRRDPACRARHHLIDNAARGKDSELPRKNLFSDPTTLDEVGNRHAEMSASASILLLPKPPSIRMLHHSMARKGCPVVSRWLKRNSTSRYFALITLGVFFCSALGSASEPHSQPTNHAGFPGAGQFPIVAMLIGVFLAGF